MTVHYPIVLETETSGAVSAYVPGLPVYAAGDSFSKAERAIRAVLIAYLEAHPGSRSRCLESTAAPRRRAHRAQTGDLVGGRAGHRQAATRNQSFVEG